MLTSPADRVRPTHPPTQPTGKEASKKASRTARSRKLRSKFRRARRRLGALTLPWAGPPLLELLSRTWKIQRVDPENFDGTRAAGNFLVTMWHGRMLVAAAPHRDLGVKVLVSPSADGSLVVPVLRRFGYGVIRGSTNKRPVGALREMVRELDGGGSIVITPDGPRGPRHSMNPGPAWMARATGLPVVPCGVVCDRAWYLSSWDDFTIPRPGARVVYVYGEPLRVPAGADDDEVRAVSEEIGRRMLSYEERGFALLGREPDWSRQGL